MNEYKLKDLWLFFCETGHKTCIIVNISYRSRSLLVGKMAAVENRTPALECVGCNAAIATQAEASPWWWMIVSPPVGQRLHRGHRQRLQWPGGARGQHDPDPAQHPQSHGPLQDPGSVQLMVRSGSDLTTRTSVLLLFNQIKSSHFLQIRNILFKHNFI